LVIETKSNWIGFGFDAQLKTADHLRIEDRVFNCAVVLLFSKLKLKSGAHMPPTYLGHRYGISV